jgi:hypothetical protein
MSICKDECLAIITCGVIAVKENCWGESHWALLWKLFRCLCIVLSHPGKRCDYIV